MAEITIRHYRGSDETALLKLWNLALTHDPINGPTGISSFRFMDDYDALGTVRGCQSGSRKAIALIVPGARVRWMAYLLVERR